jgi:hypothetical protein
MRLFFATIALSAAALPAAASAPKTITAFKAPSPGQPLSGLVAGTDGALYGIEFGTVTLNSPGAPFPSVFRLGLKTSYLKASLIPVAPAGALSGSLGTLAAGPGGVLSRRRPRAKPNGPPMWSIR